VHAHGAAQHPALRAAEQATVFAADGTAVRCTIAHAECAADSAAQWATLLDPDQAALAATHGTPECAALARTHDAAFRAARDVSVFATLSDALGSPECAAVSGTHATAFAAADESTDLSAFKEAHNAAQQPTECFSFLPAFTTALAGAVRAAMGCSQQPTDNAAQWGTHYSTIYTAVQIAERTAFRLPDESALDAAQPYPK
jgi:hypothetical protein